MQNKPIKASKLPKFKNWLIRNAVEILEPTNPYEIIRFKCSLGTGVIYQGKKGLSVNDKFVEEAYNCYANTLAWEGKGKSPKRKNTPTMKKALIKRDGNECFYCGLEFDVIKLTQEHLLSLSHNGPNRIENKVLACKPCNNLAGNLILVEKILLREQMRKETN